MALGAPVVPPEKRIAAGSSVVVATRSVVSDVLAVSAFHRRRRASSGKRGILRPLVSQKPRRLSRGRSSPMRASTMQSSGRFGRSCVKVPAKASSVSATRAPLAFR